MNLIFSQENDYVTIEVMRWLKFYNAKSTRINYNNFITIDKIELSNLTQEISLATKINGEEISINHNTIESYWYRRGKWQVNPILIPEISKHVTLREEIQSICDDESRTYASFLDYFFAFNKTNIGKYMDNDNNKLINLLHARNTKIKIPNTYILSKKSQLQELLKTKKIIVKNASQGLSHGPDTHFSGIVNEINLNDLKLIPETFHPTLFQEKIEKKYELRIYFFQNQYYSSVIYSQLDDQTKVDFRNYNNIKPNRVSPFNLPTEFKEKLESLSKSIGLNTGSFDIIVDLANNFIFLEVNPVGQFEQVSQPCNYYIEKQIAKYLINYENDTRNNRNSN